MTENTREGCRRDKRVSKYFYLIIVCNAENSDTHTWHQQQVKHEEREEGREGEVGRESKVVQRSERGVEKRWRDRGEMSRDGEYQAGK